MNIVLREPWTVDRFLAWEGRQEGKHEFDGAQIIEMTGGSRGHQRIVANLVGALLASLDPTRFDVLHEMRIEIRGKIRYPDVAVVRGPLADNVKTLRDALTLFEVLSEDTAETDLGPKKAEYLLLPSIRSYVIIDQMRREAHVLHRVPLGWQETQAGANIELPELNVVLPLNALYQGLRT